MFRGLFEGWHPLLLVLVVVLVFGANRLPGAARNLAQSLKIFKREMEGGDEKPAPPAAGTTTPAPSTPPVAAPPVATTPPPVADQPGPTAPPAGPDGPPSAPGGTTARA